MVEMAVIETASENPLPQLSTSVAVLLGFPSGGAGQQASPYGSLWFMVSYKANLTRTFTANRRRYPGRGAPGNDGC